MKDSTGWLVVFKKPLVILEINKAERTVIVAGKSISPSISIDVFSNKMMQGDDVHMKRWYKGYFDQFDLL